MKVSALQTDFIFSPIPDVDEGEEEEEEEGMGPCLPVTPKNCLSPRGISVLEKLVKTCPVWLQLGLDRVEAARILNREVTGTFLVRQDSCSKHLVLCVHFPALVGSSSKVLEYTIKEEKSILYLEGSVLVFEDIFRLIAFYCVSRSVITRLSTVIPQPFLLLLLFLLISESRCLSPALKHSWNQQGGHRAQSLAFLYLGVRGFGSKATSEE
uniref:Ras and Rab interactor 3 n=1 Tax=Molossus molossus TaxID=27622 RepID=A0A7J8K1U5_MOLMO|nr:Ras and Rab interactor 3 [Molossus molossus]